ncbi:MAG: hypothetical protein ACLFQR_13885 [Desulfovibrionales bacterium]
MKKRSELHGWQRERIEHQGNILDRIGPLPRFYPGPDIPLPPGGGVVVRNESLRTKHAYGVTGFAKRFKGWLNRDLTVIPAPLASTVESVTAFLEANGFLREQDFCVLTEAEAFRKEEDVFPVRWLGRSETGEREVHLCTVQPFKGGRKQRVISKDGNPVLRPGLGPGTGRPHHGVSLPGHHAQAE